VTTLIAEAAAKASLGMPARLSLRDLEARVDWGAAQDYVRAMWLTLQQDSGDDYIIASGEAHSVHDFAEVAFDNVGLIADDFVFQDQAITSNDALPYVGDSSKIRSKCNWRPVISFNDLVADMVDTQLNSLKCSGQSK
jgi:GDPmannose 4,6-dehydratase